jgi:hypothetical protein
MYCVTGCFFGPLAFIVMSVSWYLVSVQHSLFQGRCAVLLFVTFLMAGLAQIVPRMSDE